MQRERRGDISGVNDSKTGLQAAKGRTTARTWSFENPSQGPGDIVVSPTKKFSNFALLSKSLKSEGFFPICTYWGSMHSMWFKLGSRATLFG